MPKPIPCPNLVQNPSFEQNFAEWQIFGDIDIISHPTFEGNLEVEMGPNQAVLWQDISLAGVRGYPLFLSFNLRSSQITELVPAPRLIVEVTWLDSNERIIGYGARLFINPQSLTGAENERVTHFHIVDPPPEQAAYARLAFGKQEGNEASFIQLDQIILAPVLTSNLLTNPGFEIGLNFWTTETFEPNYTSRLEGIGAARADADNSVLEKDVFIGNHPRGSSYLLGFGLHSPALVAATAQVLWFDRNDAVIGGPGLQLLVPQLTLLNQGGYLTYLGVTSAAPREAVKAKILFFTAEPLHIDQVFFIRVASTNLIRNPGFDNELDFWTYDDVDVPTADDSYEGRRYAAMDTGSFLFQDVPLRHAQNRCFLFSFALRARNELVNGTAQVIWLDRNGNEIGLGLSLVMQTDQPENATFKWLVYAGITEPAPPGAVAARVQFGHSRDDVESPATMDIDNVIFCRLI